MFVKSQWVKTLRPGLEVASYFGIFNLNIGKTKSGSKFLKVRLGDKTGTVEGRVWDSALAEDLYQTLSTGDVVIVQGIVTEFNGLQLNLDTCNKVNKEHVELNDFRPCTDKDISKLLEEFQALLDSITDPPLDSLIKTIFKADFLADFSCATAARTIHHAYGGGLLEHTLEVMNYCSKICEIQGEVINRDLLLIGAVLHDVGKMWEYDQECLSFNHTEDGRLLGGHVILGYDFLRQQIALVDEFPDSLAKQLLHMILSHHGHKEWGAVEEPHTVEATALHYADLMSARINQVSQLVKSHQGQGDWTGFDRFLGTSLYIPECGKK